MSRSAWAAPAEIEHFEKITPLEDLPEFSDRVAHQLNMREGSLYTVFSPDGKPLAIMGANIVRDGVVEMWSFADVQVSKNFFSYARMTRDLMNTIFSDHPEIRRMQIVLDSRFAWAPMWAEFLGYQLEGTLRKFGRDGEDHFMYSKVRG